MRFILIIKSIIIVQILVIIYMVFFLNNQKNNFKAKINVSPINKNTVQQYKTKKLKYFYDLKPNFTASSSATFIKQTVINKYNNDGLN